MYVRLTAATTAKRSFHQSGWSSTTCEADPGSELTSSTCVNRSAAASSWSDWCSTAPASGDRFALRHGGQRGHELVDRSQHGVDEGDAGTGQRFVERVDLLLQRFRRRARPGLELASTMRRDVSSWRRVPTAVTLSWTDPRRTAMSSYRPRHPPSGFASRARDAAITTTASQPRSTRAPRTSATVAASTTTATRRHRPLISLASRGRR